MMNRRERIYQEFAEDLIAAERCSERALNALYAEFGPKRGVWYRWRLRRAKKALRRLVAKEIKRKDVN